jgi:hypothetical protein
MKATREVLPLPLIFPDTVTQSHSNTVNQCSREREREALRLLLGAYNYILPNDKEEAESVSETKGGILWKWAGGVRSWEEKLNREANRDEVEHFFMEGYRTYEKHCIVKGWEPSGLESCRDAFESCLIDRKVPDGVNAIEWAVRKSQETIPPEAEVYRGKQKGEKDRRFVLSVCYHLSMLRDDRVFHLGCRGLERWDVKKDTLNVILDQFVKKGFLQLVEKGKRTTADLSLPKGAQVRGHASVYRYGGLSVQRFPSPSHAI